MSTSLSRKLAPEELKLEFPLPQDSSGGGRGGWTRGLWRRPFRIFFEAFFGEASWASLKAS